MPINISADGFSVVTSKSEGTAHATIPDICKTPFPSPPGPLPLPYPNKAESKDLKAGSTPMTQFDGGSVALFGSYIEKSTGDETGNLGGIISGKTGGKAIFLNCSSTVKVEGRPVVRKGDLMITNEINTICMAGIDQDDVEGGEDLEDLEEKTLEIELKDAKGKPMANEKYIVMHSGKVKQEGSLDANGCAKIEGLKGSGYQVRFPDQESAKDSYR